MIPAGRRPLWRRRIFWDLAALAALVLSIAAAAAYITQPLLLPVRRSQPPPVDPASLEAHVRFLSEDCVPRDYDHPENLEKAADYISGVFRQSGGSVSEQIYETWKARARIVLASFGPAGPVRIVVGAHYDAWSNTPGADDNASGTAGLLELAKLLGKEHLAARVELAAYPHEELFGTQEMGSGHHAKALRERGEQIEAMVCIEMIGCFSDQPGSQEIPLRILKPLYPSRGNFVALVGRAKERAILRTMKRSMAGASGLPVRSICAPFPVPGLDLSDHYSFWKEGYPGVMVTDTAFYRNERYHTAEDTASTLDYGRMAEVVKGLHAAVRELARKER